MLKRIYFLAGSLWLGVASLTAPAAQAFTDDIPGQQEPNDQDRAREALRMGTVRPYGEIRENVLRDFGGRIMDVQLQGQERQGPMTYDLRVLRPNGEMLNVRMDARNGRVLGVERPLR